MLKTEKVFRTLNYVTMWMLLVGICLLATSTVRAQKKPPILSDRDISAFSKSEIQILQRDAGDVAHPEKAKLARNKLIAIGVEQVDAAFNDYRKKSRKRHDLLQFIFDFLEIGASSAINIINGTERAREVIAEGLSFFQGSRAAFNRDFKFLERQILFDKMVAKRSQKLTAIYEKVNSEVDVYPWEQARSEVREYFYAGTMDEALSSLSVDTGAEAKLSLKELEDAKTAANVRGKASKELLTANTDINPLFKALMDSQDLPKIKAVYALVKKDPLLEPIVKGLPNNQRLGLTPPGKKGLEDSLTAIGNGTAAFIDYNRVLFYLRVAVMDLLEAGDSKPVAAFIKVLGGN
ncbi:MAG: hypothetical protein AABM67_17205 [Acidobacteriota bacterium]